MSKAVVSFMLQVDVMFISFSKFCNALERRNSIQIDIAVAEARSFFLIIGELFASECWGLLVTRVDHGFFQHCPWLFPFAFFVLDSTQNMDICVSCFL